MESAARKSLPSGTNGVMLAVDWFRLKMSRRKPKEFRRRCRDSWLPPLHHQSVTKGLDIMGSCITQVQVDEPGAQEPSSVGEARAGVIYVVDDEAMMLEMAAVVLGSLGYTVETFPNAEAALAAFAQARSSLHHHRPRDARHDGAELIAACLCWSRGRRRCWLSGTQEEQVLCGVILQTGSVSGQTLSSSQHPHRGGSAIGGAGRAARRDTRLGPPRRDAN